MGRQPGNTVALVGWGLGINWVNLIKYLNIPCIHTQKRFYRNLIVDAQNQQLGASPTSIFPYKQCKVLFGFLRLSQHWIFSVHAKLGTLIQKNT